MDNVTTPLAQFTHADTIHYEILMLRFAAERLEPGKWDNYRDAWVYEENFLTHYRCIVDFLGKPEDKINRKSKTDVHITNLWEQMQLTSPDISKIYADGQELYKTYGDGAQERISKFLHHCTADRTANKTWPAQQMYDELNSVLNQLIPILPPASDSRLKSLSQAFVLNNFSTQVATIVPNVIFKP